MANRNDDIVKRLRDHCYECQEEAADEIERLRKQNRELLENHKLFMKECNKDIDALQSMLMKVREGNEDYFWVNPDLAKDCSRALTALIAERDAAIKHRDEARREVCCFHHLTGFLSGDYAISRGWDCYKNYSGEGFPQSVKDFKEFLKASSEEDRKTIERLQEENRQLRENKNES